MRGHDSSLRLGCRQVPVRFGPGMWSSELPGSLFKYRFYRYILCPSNGRSQLRFRALNLLNVPGSYDGSSSLIYGLVRKFRSVVAPRLPTGSIVLTECVDVVAMASLLVEKIDFCSASACDFVANDCRPSYGLEG